jgi:alpha-glucosidase (family GH31 glycosyl hydrolase)
MKRFFGYVFLTSLLGVSGACEATEQPLPESGSDAGFSSDDAGSEPDAAHDAAVVQADAAVDAGPSVPWNEGQWVVGHARFTAITPTLVRMEYDPDERFVDQPSYFAVERDARFHYAAFTSDAASLTLHTGKLELSYTDDGQPFSESNVHVTLDKGGTPLTFSPAAPNRDNLGGTTRTLDQWKGPNRLDDGVLSRAGWFRLDDSEGHLLEDDWVRERDSSEQDWYLFGYGNDYRAALASLTAIGGAVPMPRKYVLGSWYSRYWSYTADEFKAIAQEYDDHDFPLDVMVFDMGWHLDGWTGWTWNNTLIPDPPALLADLHERGLAVTLNVHPADGVAAYEAAYGDFMRALGKNPASNETVPFDAADRTYMSALFDQVHGPLSRDGADFYWLDWQQAQFTRSLPKLEHVPWLNELYYRYEEHDNLRGLSFSRWGGFGDHRHPIHFSGDASTTFKMLAFEVPFTATSSNSGLFFWTHDIGGHVGKRDDESYTRWCQFGAFSAALRSHSTNSPDLDRRPWTYPAWAEASMKKSFQLRSVLFPYIYSSARRASHDSVPLLRSLYIDHPAVEKAYQQPQEYMFGDAFLVAPIAEPGAGARRLGRQAVWFPEGTYYNFFTGERFTGGDQLVAATIDELPVFARAGVPIAMQPFTRRMATEQTSELLVRCYRGDDGQSESFVLYEDDGETNAYRDGAFATTKLTCSRKGDDITVSIAPTEGNFAGQLAMRSYVVEIPVSARGSVATLDGAKVTLDYDEGALMNRVHVPARAIGESTSVTVSALAASDDELRKRAFAMRTGVAMQASLADMVRAAWQAAASDQEKLSVLAAAGAGAFPKNENLYGFPASVHIAAYRTPWAPAEVEIADGWAGDVQHMQEGTVRFAGDEVTLRAFGDIDFAHGGTDLASTATAAFSSLEQATSNGIADRKVGGYPGNRSEEWSTAGEKTNASVTLTWDAPHSVSRVVLYDRINPNDQITGGQLSFSDGSKVDVGTIPNTPEDGPRVVDFAARNVTWLKFTVTSVSASTENVGLAELAVYGN